MPETISLRVSLSGTCRNAAEAIARAKAALARRMNEDELDGLELDYYEFALREISKHAGDTAAGKHSVEQFAEFYCLQERKEQSHA